MPLTILLVDGSYGPLHDAVIIEVPDTCLHDEHEVEDGVADGTIPVLMTLKEPLFSGQ